MTVGAGIAVQDGSLVALGAKILREVRGNVHVTPAAGGGLTNGAFLGVRSAPAGSRSVFPVGKLRYVFPHSSALLCLRCFFSLKFLDKVICLFVVHQSVQFFWTTGEMVIVRM
jgi:hypothetical protein